MKKTLVTAVITMLAGAALAASSIDWGASGSNYGVQDPLGNVVLVGGGNVYLATLLGANTTATVLAAWNNGHGTDAAVLADFAVYASGQIGDGSSPNGLFGEPTASSTDNSLFGKQLYYIMDDTAGDLGVVSAFGNTSWTVPTTTGLYPGNYTATGLDDLNAANQVVIGAFNTTADPGPNNPGYGAGINLAAIVAVPEPSSIMLVVMGLLGSIGLIRRRS